MKRFLPIALILTGCANYQPIVDTKGVDMSVYNSDLAECQAYAHQVDVVGEGVKGAAAGGAIGAAIGAIAGAFVGEVGEGAKIGAALGGAEGTAYGVAGAAEGQQQIIRNCLAGRGYTVLR